MVALNIRLYRPNDLESLIDLFIGSIREVASRDYNPEQIKAWAPDTVDRARWSERRGDGRTWVAEIEGEVVGFSDLKHDGHIDMMYVHAAHQRLGIATALLRHIEFIAHEQSLRRLFTEASITARPFFQRHGFDLLSPQLVEIRGQQLRNYRMEKLLRAPS